MTVGLSRPPVASAPAPFGDHLKTWRRARGFSQLELSSRAEVSTRHLSFLETGRATPSREMVLRLCRFLDVPLRERNALLEAAGYAASYRARPLDDEALAPVWRALETLVEHHAPWGAIIVDRTWRLRLANRPFRTLMRGLLGDLPGDLGDLNLMDLLFDPAAGVRSRVKNFNDVAAGLLAHLDADARLPGAPPALSGLAARLRALAGPLEEPKGLRVPLMPLEIDVGPLVLSLYTAVTTLASPLDVTLAELRMETYFPADEPTRRFLEDLSP